MSPVLFVIAEDAVVIKSVLSNVGCIESEVREVVEGDGV